MRIMGPGELSLTQLKDLVEVFTHIPPEQKRFKC